MMRRMLFILCLAGLTVVGSYSQARRTVTNADLEGYRQRRVAAEQQLRNDYARLGFASPEDMARQNMVSEQQLFDLSARLKQERLERERMELEHEQLMLTMFPPTAYGYSDTVQPGELFYPTVWGLGGRRGFGRTVRVPSQQGYFAGGQFWPQGPRTPVRPLIGPSARVPRH